AALSRDIPAMPVRLQGHAGGTVEGTLPPAKPKQARVVTAKIELQAPRLVVQGIPAEKLQGDITYKQGELAYRLTGDTLGGKFDLNGTVPSTEQPATPPPPGQPQGQGRLRVEGVRLGR